MIERCRSMPVRPAATTSPDGCTVMRPVRTDGHLVDVVHVRVGLRAEVQRQAVAGTIRYSGTRSSPCRACRPAGWAPPPNDDAIAPPGVSASRQGVQRLVHETDHTNSRSGDEQDHGTREPGERRAEGSAARRLSRTHSGLDGSKPGSPNRRQGPKPPAFRCSSKMRLGRSSAQTGGSPAEGVGDSGAQSMGGGFSDCQRLRLHRWSRSHRRRAARRPGVSAGRTPEIQPRTEPLAAAAGRDRAIGLGRGRIPTGPHIPASGPAQAGSSPPGGPR